MKQRDMCLIIGSTAIAFVLGLIAGVFWIRPDGDDNKVIIKRLESNLANLKSSTPIQIEKAETVIRNLQNNIHYKEREYTSLFRKYQTLIAETSQRNSVTKAKIPLPEAGQSQESKLYTRLSYLSDIPEIRWYEIDDNNVYIGFEPLPDDWRNIINAAAANGNRAINFGCHVWAVYANDKNWRPGDGPCYGETTVRHGRLE